MPLIGRRAMDGQSPNDNKNQITNTGLRHRRAAFSLGTFSWPNKRKYLGCPAETGLNIQASRQRFILKIRDKALLDSGIRQNDEDVLIWKKRHI